MQRSEKQSGVEQSRESKAKPISGRVVHGLALAMKRKHRYLTYQVLPYAEIISATYMRVQCKNEVCMHIHMMNHDEHSCELHRFIRVQSLPFGQDLKCKCQKKINKNK